MLYPNNLHFHNAQAYRLVGLHSGEVMELFVFGLCSPSPVQSLTLGIRRAQGRLHVGWRSGWSANTGPMDVKTLRGISHKASYGGVKDRQVQRGRESLLSTLQGIDQPRGVQNKHGSVLVNTKQITGLVT